MDKIEPAKDSIALPVDKIIDLIRELRNAIIKGFLIDENLLPYFKSQYNKELSNVKRELLKRDLKELLISPVDAAHYSALIKEVKETKNSALAYKNETLFYDELATLFRKYVY